MPKTHRITLPQPLHAAGLRGEVSMLLVRMRSQPSVVDPEWHFGPSMDYGCHYAPGDLIACREPWGAMENDAFFYPGHDVGGLALIGAVAPASRMPLAACRLWFRVQAVSACRVQDVIEEEACAMGFPTHCAEHTYRKVFRDPEERARARVDCFRQAWEERYGHFIDDWAWKLKVERVKRNA